MITHGWTLAVTAMSAQKYYVTTILTNGVFATGCGVIVHYYLPVAPFTNMV